MNQQQGYTPYNPNNPYAPGGAPNPAGQNQAPNPYGPTPSAAQANPYQNPYGQQQNPYGPAASNPYAPPQQPAYGSYGASTDMHVLADRGTRLGARLIDQGLLIGCLLIMAPFLASNNEGVIAAGVGLALVAALGLGIYQWVLIAQSGQSLGKKWTGIKIVKVDGSDVDFMSGVILRNWVIGAINAVVGIVGIVDVLMIFAEDRRCLHDHIAGTKVIVA